MVKAAKTIRRHWQGILSWAYQRISIGILEGFNSIFQAAKSKAKDYQKFETILTIIYLLTGKLDFSKINPYSATHTIEKVPKYVIYATFIKHLQACKANYRLLRCILLFHLDYIHAYISIKGEVNK